MKRLLLLLLSIFLLGSCHCGDADSKQAFQNAAKEVTATITAEKLPEPPDSFMSVCHVNFGASPSESALRPQSRINFSLTGRPRLFTCIRKSEYGPFYLHHPVLSGINSVQNHFISLRRLRV
ncbi:MAG: hypothetical protein SPJ43_06040 [Candidatus Cryptobacteroides sp.]|nr:hypothetical protein [Candidatus Cryptobacteroides sp.]